MPGGSVITVTIDGTQIRAADGAYLDADLTGGTSGSVLTFSFKTVSVSPLIGNESER